MSTLGTTRFTLNACRSCIVLENDHVLRLIGLLIVVLYTGIGAMLLVSSEGTSRIIGLGLVLMGLAWLVIDVLRRRADI